MVEGLETVSLPAVISRYGVELSRRGRNLVGLCPFHADKDPSFTVFPDGRFKCFGCGEHGDAADFVQKAQGVDFKGALQILGIRPGRPVSAKKIRTKKKRRTLISQFRAWEIYASDYAGTMVRCAHKVLSAIKDPGDLDLFAGIYHGLCQWQYDHDVLACGTDRDKFELWRSGRYEQ